MKVVEALDSPILAFFTNISHRIQIVTGKTNFFLAKVALCAVIIDIMITILNYWFPLLEKQTNLIYTIFEILILFACISVTTECDRAEQSAQSDNPTKSPLECSSVLRLTVLFFLCAMSIPMDIKSLMVSHGVFAFKFYHLISDIAFIAYVYLISVHPLPPGKSKIREWIESFAAGFMKQAPSR